MRKKISRKRKQELMREALRYAGQLVRQVVNSYSAFESLPEHEQAFIDEYIVSIGDRLWWQGQERDERSATVARRIVQAAERSDKR